jgi:hypothetical protein
MEIKGPYEPGFPKERGRGFEERDASIKGLIQFAFWMAVVLAVTLVGMKWTFDYFKRAEPMGPTASPLVTESQRVLPPSPRLQAQPHLELAEYCTAQQQEVTTYSWVDQGSGVVHIPVDRAMDLILERGLPARPLSEAPSGAASAPVATPITAGGNDLLGPCGYLSEHPVEAAPMGRNE